MCINKSSYFMQNAILIRDIISTDGHQCVSKCKFKNTKVMKAFILQYFKD